MHSYDLYCAQGLPQGSSLKKKSDSRGSFIRGKSVKEEVSISNIAVLGIMLPSLKKIMV